MRKGSRVERAALVLLAAVVVVMSGGGARAEEWEPWAAGEEFPTLSPPADESASAGDPSDSGVDGPAALPLIGLVRVYQAWFSPVYGSRCQMLPSCSRYCVDAIRKHGPLLGIVMTSGRLLHEPDERRYAAIRVSGREYRFLDPVENNDFWFAAE